ncbi:MAG: hypothetical protein R3F43_13415 [bacterium]
MVRADDAGGRRRAGHAPGAAAGAPRRGPAGPDGAAPERLRADLVLLAMGFLGPELADLNGIWASTPGRAGDRGDAAFATSVPGVFAAGDAVRGASLVVHALSQGRECARAVDAWLRGGPSSLPTRGDELAFDWTLPSAPGSVMKPDARRGRVACGGSGRWCSAVGVRRGRGGAGPGPGGRRGASRGRWADAERSRDARLPAVDAAPAPTSAAPRPRTPPWRPTAPSRRSWTRVTDAGLPTVQRSHEREMRGVWIATVFNIVFPSRAGLSVDAPARRARAPAGRGRRGPPQHRLLPGPRGGRRLLPVTA